jgi:hypothetical protein
MVKRIWFIPIAQNENNEKQAETCVHCDKKLHFHVERLDFTDLSGFNGSGCYGSDSQVKRR